MTPEGDEECGRVLPMKSSRTRSVITTGEFDESFAPFVPVNTVVNVFQSLNATKEHLLKR